MDSVMGMSIEELTARSDETLERLADLRTRLEAQKQFEANLPPRTPDLTWEGPERRMVVRLAVAVDQCKADLCNLHAAMVVSIARKWAGGRQDLVEEYLQAGRLGLLQAIDSYKVGAGKFSSWAYKHIVRQVAEARNDAADTPLSAWDRKIEPRIRRAQRAVLAANPQANELGPEVMEACKDAIADGVSERTVVSILTATRMAGLDVSAPLGTPSHDQAVEEAQLVEQIREAAEGLDDECRIALVMRLGLDGEHEATWDEIADRIGFGAGTARLRFEEAVSTIRGRMTRTPAGFF